MNKDEEQLDLLRIFHYVLAGMSALISLFPILHLLMGLAIVSGLIPIEEGENSPVFIGWILIGISVFMIGFGMTYAGIIALSGRYIGQRKHYTFCRVAAGFACLMMPFGTALGVFTIIVLMRESVKELFDRPVEEDRDRAIRNESN